MGRIKRVRVVILPWLMNEQSRALLMRAIHRQDARITIEGELLRMGSLLDNRLDIELGEINTLEISRLDVGPPYPVR